MQLIKKFHQLSQLLMATLVDGTLLLGGCAGPYDNQPYLGVVNLSNQYAPLPNQQSYPQIYNGSGVI
ncbi:MAG: hypothetical protein H7240_13450 [Glaciimonas sp.]|nr:hypothetical protein [Glaciimonas sp.]